MDQKGGGGQGSGPPPPGKSQVTMGCLRNSGTETSREGVRTL